VIQKFVSENGYTIPIALGGEGYAVGKAYGIQAYPTNYLVDGDGKIVWRTLGFSEEALREALKELGVQ
jgi:hypothetical protein